MVVLKKIVFSVTMKIFLVFYSIWNKKTSSLCHIFKCFETYFFCSAAYDSMYTLFTIQFLFSCMQFHVDSNSSKIDLERSIDIKIDLFKGRLRADISIYIFHFYYLKFIIPRVTCRILLHFDIKNNSNKVIVAFECQHVLNWCVQNLISIST